MTLLHQAAQKAVEALKPCPFCGNAAEHRERNGGYFVQCDTCDTRTASRLRPDYAAAHWNQRESALQQQPEPVAPWTVDDLMQLVFRYGAARCDVDRSNTAKNQRACNEAIDAIRDYIRGAALQHQEEPREPVAWVHKDALIYHLKEPGGWAHAHSERVPGTYDLPLYASPSTTRQQEVGSAPEGFRLLPVEATDAMMYADWDVTMSDAHSNGGVSAAAWRAMVEAAPQVTYGNGHSGVGWYMHDTDYPEEGAVFLGAAAPSTPEKAGGVPAFDPTQPCLMQSHTLIGPAPTMTYCQRCKNPHHACDGGVPSPIPHPLPAQANDGGEHDGS